MLDAADKGGLALEVLTADSDDEPESEGVWFDCSYRDVEPIGPRLSVLTSGRWAVRLGLRGGGDFDATDVEL